MSPRPKRAKSYLPAYIGLFILFLISAMVRVRSTADQLDNLLHGTERARAPIDSTGSLSPTSPKSNESCRYDTPSVKDVGSEVSRRPCARST
jgi:hypothetical protein